MTERLCELMRGLPFRAFELLRHQLAARAKWKRSAYCSAYRGFHATRIAANLRARSILMMRPPALERTCGAAPALLSFLQCGQVAFQSRAVLTLSVEFGLKLFDQQFEAPDFVTELVEFIV